MNLIKNTLFEKFKMPHKPKEVKELMRNLSKLPLVQYSEAAINSIKHAENESQNFCIHCQNTMIIATYRSWSAGNALAD